MTDDADGTTLDRRGLAKNRIEALADGIFAVAMTLLVLDIKSPRNRAFETTGDLVDHLVALEHSFAMYAISFLVLAIFWIVHHLLFHFVRHVDRRLLWLNIAFLLLVTFVPFSTDLLGDHGHLTLPVVVYGMNLLALGTLLDFQLRYLRAHPRLAAPDLTSETAARMQSEVRIYALIPLASMAVAFYSPRLGMYLYLLLLIPTIAAGRFDRALHGGKRHDADSLLRRPMNKILILGINGFIGHHLTRRILDATDWEVFGMDMQTDRIADLMPEKRFHFFEGDITINREWIEYHIKKCDTVLPLVAIATPATYVREPLRVFELDFEANLPFVRACVRYGKRIVFPSTSEVYGMCDDALFDPETSNLVLGPINKPRWIYACAKQLMDRVIHAYGMQAGLDYTLFRPFNWIGAGLDSINATKEGSSRVITQFLGHIVRGEPIRLVDGGTQKRTFTYIDDGIDALVKIIANAGGIASGKIYNIGNPDNNVSVRELATMMVDLALTYSEYRDSAARVKIVETTAAAYYGAGYQDVQNRVPMIANTCDDLAWKPTVPMRESLKRIFDAYRGQVAEARRLVE